MGVLGSGTHLVRIDCVEGYKHVCINTFTYTLYIHTHACSLLFLDQWDEENPTCGDASAARRAQVYYKLLLQLVISNAKELG